LVGPQNSAASSTTQDQVGLKEGIGREREWKDLPIWMRMWLKRAYLQRGIKHQSFASPNLLATRSLTTAFPHHKKNRKLTVRKEV